MVASQLRPIVSKLMNPIYVFLARLGIHPNTITIVGLGFGVLAGWAFASGAYMVAAISIALSGIMDLLDGGVARVSGYASSEGAFLDSISDRLGESAVYIGLVIGFEEMRYQLIGLGLLVFSYSISYLRARGEGLGVELAGIGVMERAERMTALFFVAFLANYFSQAVLVYSLMILLVLILTTVVHRFVRVYNTLRIESAA